MKSQNKTSIRALVVCVAGISSFQVNAATASADRWEAPSSADLLKNPMPFDAESIARGKQLYVTVCAACHGTKGDGDGPAAAAMEKHPGVLSGPMMGEHSDGALFWKIKEGRAPMPPFEAVFPVSQRWDIVNYIRTLSVKPAHSAAAAAPAAPSPAVSAKPAPVPLPPAAAVVSPTPIERDALAPASGQSSSTGDYVTRAEYERLQRQLFALQGQLDALAGRLAAPANSAENAAATQPETVQHMETNVAELTDEVKGLRKTVADLRPGLTNNLVTGYAFAGFTKQIDGNSTFGAGLNPILLWQTSDRLLFESEIELELADGKTAVGLEYAHLTYLLNDYVTIGAGKFLTPFGIFRERLHPAWINKLPDAPPAFGHHGLIPPSTLGVQLRGGFQTGESRWNYTVFLGNGPRLNTGGMEPDEAGMLHFDNDNNLSSSKMAGVRVGFLPIPEFEIGYSGLFAQMKDLAGASKPSADADLHGLYLSYVRDSDKWKGLLDIKAEWMWSRVDRLTYDPNGMMGFGPLRYGNRRNGGYVQAAYRPTKAAEVALRDFETVFRFDRLNLPSGAPENEDSWRYTFGLNYWLNAQTALKASYQFENVKKPGMETQSHDTLFLQAAMGF
ncbi:MAG: c-type cytochrome [Opitutus sp.]